MPDIYHDFPLNMAVSRVLRAVSMPADLAQWWTTRSKGQARPGAEYELWFGPQDEWRAKVTRCAPNAEFEPQLTRADREWLGTKVGFHLEAKDGKTRARFYHVGWPNVGWPTETERYRVSCYCWAVYLRVLRRYFEHGESLPYERRLDVYGASVAPLLGVLSVAVSHAASGDGECAVPPRDGDPGCRRVPLRAGRAARGSAPP